MALCKECGRDRPDQEVQLGVCDECFNHGPPKTLSSSKSPQTPRSSPAASLPLTTGFEVPGNDVVSIVKIVGAEVVFGLNLLKDIANNFRDMIGGRSKASQNAISEARELCLRELSLNAHEAGGQAVIGVRITVSEMSTSGSGLLVVAATGTAVLLRPVQSALEGPSNPRRQHA